MPPRPTMTTGPKSGSRDDPTMSSRPGEAIGWTRRPRTASPRIRPRSNNVCAASRTSSALASPRRTAPMSLLWASSRASSLSATGPPPNAAAAATASSGSLAERTGTTWSPAARSSSRLSRSASARPTRTSTAWLSVSSSWPAEVRLVANSGQVGRAGPCSSRSARRRSHQARPTIARAASRAPRSSGTPPAASSCACISGVGSPEVSDTYTGRISGRPAVASSSARLTDCATASSPGRDRYGKSCTTASTS